MGDPLEAAHQAMLEKLALVEAQLVAKTQALAALDQRLAAMQARLADVGRELAQRLADGQVSIDAALATATANYRRKVDDFEAHITRLRVEKAAVQA